MQRRAAAVYVVFFLLVGTASYALIATAHEPALEPGDLSNKKQLQQNESFSIGGEKFKVTKISPAQSGGGGGGHGGGGGGSAATATIEHVSSKQTNPTKVEDKGTATLNGERYFAVIPNDNTVILSQDFESLRETEEAAASYDKNLVGLWGVTILSGISAVLLVGFAYLPSRY